MKIEDPRVHDLCNKAGQPSPFQILCECLRRYVHGTVAARAPNEIEQLTSVGKARVSL